MAKIKRHIPLNFLIARTNSFKLRKKEIISGGSLQMKFIDNKGITDPSINLALEEYVLQNFGEKDTYLLFYINEPSIIIGRNQNRSEEHTSELQSRGHLVCRLLLEK